MKSFRKELWFNTKNKVDFLNITPLVEAALHESQIQEGLCLVNAMHITASIFINDAETGLHQDFKDWLEKISPTIQSYIGITELERQMAMHT